MNRVQPIARIRDVIDSHLQRGWYAPAGTYDGRASGRPFRHVRCHICDGKHFAEGHAEAKPETPA